MTLIGEFRVEVDEALALDLERRVGVCRAALEVRHRRGPAEVVLLLCGAHADLVCSAFALVLHETRFPTGALLSAVVLCLLLFLSSALFSVVVLEERTARPGVAVQHGPYTLLLPISSLLDRVLSNGDGGKLLLEILNEHEVAFLREVAEVMAALGRVTFARGAM